MWRSPLICCHVAHRVDEIWLLSGSRDLERLVEVLRARGVAVVVFSTEGMLARELRNAADRFVDLAGLRPRLEKASAAQQPVFHRGVGKTPIRKEGADRTSDPSMDVTHNHSG